MQTNDPGAELRSLAEYLQRAMGHILTLQEHQKKHFEAQSQRQDQQVRDLTQSAQALSASAGRIVDDASRGIREQTRDAIAQGAGEGFGRIRAEAEPVISELKSATAGLARERQQLAQDRRRFTWIGLACLATGSVLAVIGSGAYSWARLKEAAQAERTLGHLRALSELETARCGDGYCASVDLDDSTEHAGRTYYRIKPRAPE